MKANKRWDSRHFNEDAFARCEARLQQNPALMRQRMAIVKPPFAILKQIMGLRRFLCRGIEDARSEMSPGVLSYNLNRMINREGVAALLAALRLQGHSSGRIYPRKYKKTLCLCYILYAGCRFRTRRLTLNKSSL